MGTRINNLPTAESVTDDMYIVVDGADGTYKTPLKNLLGKGGSSISQMSMSVTLQSNSAISASEEE